MTHKNIIVEKFNQKKNVVVMYKALLGRRERKGLDTTETKFKIEKTKGQMQMLLDRHPQYFI